MKSNTISLSLFQSNCFRVFLFWVCWLLFLILGSLYANRVDWTQSSLMCMALSESLSIVGLTVTLFFPLFAYYLTIYFQLYFLIPVFLAAKAFGIGWIVSVLYSLFPGVGFLVSVLFLFSDVLMLIWVLYIWKHVFVDGTAAAGRMVLYYALTALIVGGIDYFCISPFLYSLLRLS